MTQLYRSWVLTAMAAGALFGQQPAPAPVAPVPPMPPAAPVSPAWPFNDEIRQKIEMAREKAELAREKIETMHFDMDMRFEMDPMLWAQKIIPEGGIFGHGPMARSGHSDLYNRGMESLDQRNFERALTAFDEYYRATAEQKDSRADGALYWKAYTLNKLGRRPDALATLALLEKTYPSSRWLNDAKALQLEVNQASGQGASPESQSAEDLKLLAINGLLNTDPERTVPLLEKLLSDPKASPRLKSRALFVLAQSRNPRAGEIIARYAKAGGNPDVQLKAVEYLGVYGSKENRQVLSDLYSSSNDPALKRAVLRGYLVGKDKDRLLAAAKNEANLDLRQEAIRDLGALGAQAELGQLYAAQNNTDVKRAIIHSLSMRREKSADTLGTLYAGESDKSLKKEILHALRNQDGAKQLVDIARKETDPSLKQEAVRDLSMMHSKEATDYLMELLNK